MWFKKYLRSYKTVIFLGITISLLTTELFVMTSVVADIDNSTRQVAQQIRNMRLRESEENIGKLSKLMERVDIPTYNADTARSWLLEMTEEFKNNYDARILSPITEKESSFRTTVRFKYTPVKPDDILQFMEYLKNSISPIYNITDMQFKDYKGTRIVDITMEMIQPYVGGEYHY